MVSVSGSIANSADFSGSPSAVGATPVPPGGQSVPLTSGVGLVHPAVSNNSFDWTQLNATVAPSPRAGAAMVFDAADGYTLLFGGCPQSTTPYSYHTCIALGDTWTLSSGGVWTNLTSSLSTSPPARADAGIAYDNTDRCVVMFGGYNGTVLYNDTWTFDSGNWTHVSTNATPPARFLPGMTGDGSGGGVTLFGGANQTGGNSFNDTWTYLGGNWTLVSTATAPAPRFAMAMTYDSADRSILLFGGWSVNQPNSFGDTWTYSNGTWSNVTSLTAPSPRNYPALAFDPALNASVLTGGHVGPNGYNDTWAYNASNGWNLIPANAPSPRWGIGLAYDSSSHVLWSFGGTDPSWTVFNGTFAFGPTLLPNLTVTPSNGVAPLVVNFTSNPTGGFAPLVQSWTFGVGAVGSTTGNTTFTYFATGMYVSQLTIDSAAGIDWVFNHTIAVYSPLSASASAAPSTIDLPFGVNFTSHVAGGVPPVGVEWNFGDGQVGTHANESHAYSTNGQYHWSMFANDSAGHSNESSGVVTVNPVLSLVSGSNVAGGPAPLIVRFSAAAAGGDSEYSYVWSFGDGSTNATTANVKHTYALTGPYSATISVRDGTGNLVSQTLSILAYTPLTVDAAPVSAAGEAPYTANFEALASGGSGPDSYFWVFGPGLG